MKLTGKAHRFAEFWPIDPNVIEEMAEDIKANGQRVPILALPDGTIIDGRTRYMACKKASVEPKVEVHNNGSSDEEIASLIKSLNRERRHSSASVCACVDAETLEALGERRGGDRKSKDAKSNVNKLTFDSSANRDWISKAKSLLIEAPDLFALAKAGQGSVGEHYKTLKDRRAESERQAIQMDEVARYDPELKRSVESGAMTIAESVAEMERRKAAESQEERERRESIERETSRIGDVCGVWSNVKGKRLSELASLISFEQYRGAFWKENPFTLKSLRRTGEFFIQLADEIEKTKGTK